VSGTDENHISIQDGMGTTIDLYFSCLKDDECFLMVLSKRKVMTNLHGVARGNRIARFNIND
jgi:hypothetical protein